MLPRLLSWHLTTLLVLAVLTPAISTEPPVDGGTSPADRTQFSSPAGEDDHQMREANVDTRPLVGAPPFANFANTTAGPNETAIFFAMEDQEPDILQEEPGWVVSFRFAIEGITQGIVGIFGIIGESCFENINIKVLKKVTN